jgi:hypothetical protein
MNSPSPLVSSAHSYSTFAALAKSDVDRLGENIAELASRIHAATYDLLVMLRDFDAQLGWNNGFLSCAHWLHWRTGIDLGAAREKVRVAHALARLPRISAVLQHGIISYAKARALTRVATPANEAQLLDIALAGTAAHVERVVSAWRRCDRVAAAKREEHRHLHRELTTWTDDDGMLVIRGRLTPEVGAVVRRALEAAMQQLRDEAQATPPPRSMAEETTSGQRRADALARVAEAALAGELDTGTAGDRYQVVVHVDEADAHSTLELDGGRTEISAETSRRLACDASVVVMRHDSTGNVLDVGRKTRTIPPAIRRALLTRDGQCQFPGCSAQCCDAHHLEHWADGGSTSLDNLTLLCRRHHRFVHEGGWTVQRDADGITSFGKSTGERLPQVPDAPAWATPRAAKHRGPVRWLDVSMRDPLRATRDRLDAAGVSASARTAHVWDGTPFRLGDVIDVLRGREPLPTMPPVTADPRRQAIEV